MLEEEEEVSVESEFRGGGEELRMTTLEVGGGKPTVCSGEAMSA